MKVAIIHYWLINIRGGEKVLEALCELFPEADIFTHVYIKDKFKSSVISNHKVNTTFINSLPFSRNLYQVYLPLMPMALEELNLADYDLIISSESGPAKGVIAPPGVRHICYCHSPMRYIWDMHYVYKSHSSFIKRLFMAPLMHYLRRWDQLTSVQVTEFIANSTFVSERINSYYGRTSTVIPPPVDVEKFNPSNTCEDFYLVLGQLVNYKKVDLAIKAFNLSGKKLVVIGTGEQYTFLKSISKSNITLLGHQPFDVVRSYLSKCKALIFPGVEDFGIVPIEAMASGKPVIAYAKGGILDSVIDGKTGVLFSEQTENSLNNAVENFEKHFVLDISMIRKHAEKFSKELFKKKIYNFIYRK